MRSSHIPEDLVTLLHAISEDKRLCDWLLGLQSVPLAVRQSELSRMAARMRSAGEDSAVADAVSALARPRLFGAACSTLRELQSKPRR